MNKLETFLDELSLAELAEGIDFVLIEHFAQIDPKVLDFYDKQMRILRFRDTVKSKISEIRRYNIEIERYKHYAPLRAIQPKLRELYKDYCSKNDAYVDEFFEDSLDVQEVWDLFHSVKLEVSKKNYQKLLLNKRTDGKRGRPSKEDANKILTNRIPLQKPVCPVSKDDPIDYDRYADECQKTNAHLLEQLGRQRLINIIYFLIGIWDEEDISSLYPFLLFTIAQWYHSKTKAKGRQRVEQQEKNRMSDMSMTTGKPLIELIKDLKKLKNNLA